MHLFDILQSSPEDIVNGVKDIIDGLEGREPSAAAKEIQDTYGKLYLSHATGYEFGGKIGARFALKYRDFIVPGDEAAHTPEVN